MYILLSVLAVFLILSASEIGWRKRWFSNDSEIGRKFVHITVGSFVAFWPFFLSWNEIRLLSVAFLIVVAVSARFKLFRAIHSVQRPTFGEICFAMVVGALTFITRSKGIYAAALLQMSVADGLAAVIGTRLGRKNTYQVFGHAKSVVGTLTFFVTATLILSGYSLLSVKGLAVSGVVLGALGGAIVENVAVLGLDNLIVPLFIGLLLTSA
ncbi:MAG TPA: hypothetical protein VLG92_01820 [Candidatus Saccharimonadia bacterium]|nr:hypothetical protein [Candidatus Saccharimonadia bacterium]